MEYTVYNTKDGNFADAKIKGDKLEYFLPGTGWKKTKKFNPIGSVDYADDWYQVTDICRKFGLGVASWSTNFIAPYATQTTYSVIYNNWRERLENNNFLEETIRTCFKLISPDYMLAMFGGSSVDVIRLDKDIKTPNGTSTKDHITNVYGNDVGLAIECLLKN